MNRSASLENIAIVTTHPIQYQIPWYQALSNRDDIRLVVYFMFLPDPAQQGEGFDCPFNWDIPVLTGYSWSVLKTQSGHKSTSRFFGLRICGLAETLIRDNIDFCIIHGWSSYGLFQALAACKKLGIRTLVRGEANTLRSRPFWKNVFHRFLLRQYDAYLGIGHANVEFYRKHGVDAKRIFWCPYGVDNGRFHGNIQALRPHKETIRKKWNISDDETCFLFAGKFQRKKRILDLIHALYLARKQNDKMRLLAVGAGEEELPAREISNKLAVPITFTGFLNQSEISEAYVAADCLVLPSDYDETWGLVVNEAMASEIPAIVSDRVGCGPDLVFENSTGAVFRFGDIANLSETLLMMAADRNKRVRMGRHAYQHILKYGVEQASSGVIQALNYLRAL